VEDLVQFALFLGFILIWLLGTGKKKKTQRPQQRPQQKRPQVQTQRRPDPSSARAPTTPRSRAPAQQPPSATRQQPETLADLLRDVLKGELPDATRVPEPEPEPEPYEFGAPEPEVFTEEAASLETLEPTGEPSHRVFHERYVDVPAVSAPRARHRYRLTPTTAREAVIWTAIFSHPKGME
jgi:hypothetical protein